MIEVEVKLPIYRRSITERGLKEAGFEAGDLIEESDIYYTAGFHDFIKLDEALRIRTSRNLTGQKAVSYLTFKGKKLDDISMTRLELETMVEDGTVADRILCALGFEPLFPVKKLRQYYHRGPVTACLDQVSELGSFLELEIQVDEETGSEEALSQISGILSALGSDMSETTRRSYLSMLMKKKGILIDPA